MSRQVREREPLNLTAPPDWNEYQLYVQECCINNRSVLEYEDWAKWPKSDEPVPYPESLSRRVVRAPRGKSTPEGTSHA